MPPTSANNFFGIKVSQPGVNINTATIQQLLYTNDYTTETYYNQSGGVALQLGNLGNLNYGLQTATNNGGTITYGSFTSAITGASASGMQITDDTGNVLFEMDGQTWYWFDPNNGYVNNMQIGLLPDGSYGTAIATTGNSVASIYS